MANFHLEFEPISRKRGRSPVKAATYQSGEKLRDDYYGKTYYHSRHDILHIEILLPAYAPPEFYNRQILWREIDKAEKRIDARTAYRAIGSLPNEKEFTLPDHVEIVREYVTNNFINMGMCADIAIHEGKHKNDPMKNNPHVHILLPDRPISRDGFCPKKNRDWNDWKSNKLIKSQRDQWAEVQNRAYERKGLDVRITAKGYIERGLFDIEPRLYLSRKDMYFEQKGIRTIRGDENRAIKERNREREENERSRDRGW